MGEQYAVARAPDNRQANRFGVLVGRGWLRRSRSAVRSDLSTSEGTPERRLARAESVCLGSKEADPYRDHERAEGPIGTNHRAVRGKERGRMSVRRTRLRLIAAVAALAVASLLAVPSEVHAGTTKTYVVLYKGSSVSSDAANVIAGAGGTMLIAYKQIGVAIATSDSSTFRANLLRDSRIQGAQSTAGFGVQLDDGAITGGGPGPAEHAGDRLGQPVRAAVGHGADPCAGGPCDHRRESRRAGRRHRHRPGLHASGPRRERRQREQRQLRERRCRCRARWPRTTTTATERTRPARSRPPQRHRHRGCRAEREDRRDQGRQRRRVLLPGGRDLRVHVGRHARVRRHEQQLLRGPVAVQLQERPRAAGDLGGRAPRDQVRDGAGRHGGGRRRQPG